MSIGEITQELVKGFPLGRALGRVRGPQIKFSPLHSGPTVASWKIYLLACVPQLAPVRQHGRQTEARVVARPLVASCFSVPWTVRQLVRSVPLAVMCLYSIERRLRSSNVRCASEYEKRHPRVAVVVTTSCPFRWRPPGQHKFGSTGTKATGHPRLAL